MLIDSHVNLHAEAFDQDRADVIARARDAGIGTMITICDRLDNAPKVLAIAQSDPHIWASVGVHPHYAKDYPALSASTLIDLARAPKVVGIGETGLDLHYGYSPLEYQKRALDAHIEAARTLDLPLILHAREADVAMAEALETACAKGPLRLLLHCYTSGAELARRALALGAYFSLSGILTFKNAHDVRAVAAQLPLDRIILETDCPYLAPLPHRGRRNEPAFLADLQTYFCSWRGLSPSDGASILADNFHRLFHTIPR